MFVRAKKSGRYEYLPVVQNERVDGRVRQRVIRGKFNIERICIVAELRQSLRSVSYILGVRMRAVKQVRETVLADKQRFETVYGPRETSKAPAPLKVKEVVVGFGALHRLPQRGAGEDRKRDRLRRQMGAADGPEGECQGSGLTVQRPVDGGDVLP